MTQKDVGIMADHNATGAGFEKPSRETYNQNHGRLSGAPTSGGQRTSSKSLGGPWSADRPLKPTRPKSGGKATD